MRSLLFGAGLRLVRRSSLFVVALLLGGCGAAPLEWDGPTAEWPTYGNDAGGMRHSPLTQIHRDNVDDLEVAWIHRSGDVLDGSTSLGKSSFQNTPIVIGESLYYCTPKNRVFALDAETGEERWVYDPGVDVSQFYVINCRGVSYWLDAEAETGSQCRERIITGTLDARLISLDAATGAPCGDFGKAGEVDLTEGIGDTEPGEYGVTSPPVVIGDLIVTGSMVLDNRRVDAPGGVVRAYHARNGKRVWGWDPVAPGAPRLGERGYTRGTTNAWSVFSVDVERGLVYVPTGNTSADYYGGHRDGSDYYSSAVVALDAQTGRVRWHFKTVVHDIWDYDVPSQPVLFDFPGDKGPVPSLIQPTKVGHLFFLDRESGAPIFGVEDRPVPQEGVVPGEFLSPTQPFPLKPAALHPYGLSEEEAFGFTPFDRDACRNQVAGLRSEGVFTPPSLEGSIQYPGMIGGFNWGSVAVDPERQLVIGNTQRIATRIRLIPREEFKEMFPGEAPAFGYEPQEGTPYALERLPLLSPLGAPCNPPPWGTLAAVDLKTGELRWEVPLGTTRDLAPFPVWLSLGTPNLGGPVVTAGGLIFIGASTDFFLRAFDVENGEELWKARLPTSANATPMTYRTAQDRRQFVVVAAGGHGILGTPPSDALMAFALPGESP